MKGIGGDDAAVPCRELNEKVWRHGRAFPVDHDAAGLAAGHQDVAEVAVTVNGDPSRLMAMFPCDPHEERPTRVR